MTYTNNYSLPLYEGTDLMNPFTFENEVARKSDVQMRVNSLHTIGSATESAQGVVHNLIRDNSEIPFFTFTATADFKAGHSVTVDGLAVSAVLPNGAGIGSEAWRINSAVLCCLTGNLLTVYTVGGATDVDAVTLNGHPASYFGTAQAVNSANEAAVSAQSVAQAALPKSNLTFDVATQTLSITL